MVPAFQIKGMKIPRQQLPWRFRPADEMFVLKTQTCQFDLVEFHSPTNFSRSEVFMFDVILRTLKLLSSRIEAMSL